MTQAIVDPAELRRFAQTLKKFNTELAERTSALANQLADLNNTWRDQEQTKFREQFEQHMKMIARFVEANNQHIPYLLRKAERIEEYMQQR
jgi:WXG100 family type VII secretion target